MPRFPKVLSKYLETFGLFFFVAFHCGAQMPPKPFIALQDEAHIYNASLTFRNNYLSGTAIFKTDSIGTNVVILSKFGFTLIDFVLTDQEVIWHKKPPGMEKRAHLKAVEKDFRMLLLTPLVEPKKWKYKKDNRFIISKNIKIAIRTSPNNQQVLSSASRQFLSPFKSNGYYLYPSSGSWPVEMSLNRRIPRIAIKLSETQR